MRKVIPPKITFIPIHDEQTDEIWRRMYKRIFDQAKKNLLEKREKLKSSDK